MFHLNYTEKGKPDLFTAYEYGKRREWKTLSGASNWARKNLISGTVLGNMFNVEEVYIASQHNPRFQRIQ